MVPLVAPACCQLQVTRCAWRLRCPVVTDAYLCRESEMTAQMRDMLEKQSFVSQGDVVEQHKVLVQLSHVSDMRRQGKAKLSGEKTDRKKLARAGQPSTVGLDVMQSASLQKILEQNAIGNVFSSRDFHRRDLAR